MIHIISKEYYLKNLGESKLKKILVSPARFPNIYNRFFMTDNNVCFLYLFEQGFLIVPEDSGLDGSILGETLDGDGWHIEKIERPLNLTKNYINSFSSIWIHNTGKQKTSWVKDYTGYIRVWNDFTKESFTFYKTTPGNSVYPIKDSNSNSYSCRIVTGDKIEFPIDLIKENEFNKFIKDILEWM